MIQKIDIPTVVRAAGNKTKHLLEYFGRANSHNQEISVAKMISPQGWIEPGQTPEFDEYTLVLHGLLKVKTREKTYEVKAGEAIFTGKGEWVQYSTPYDGGAEYIAICLPAFSRDTVHRDV
jgi:mannose-6-phosphate isomerase-like protein (cupin superfamily)